MVGIDISGVQNTDVPGNWEFMVVKSTEGNTVVNLKVDAQWKNAARTTRGLYHYARPLRSSGTSQANTFCDDALRRGFKPNVDLWQLDCEEMYNEGTSQAQWREFIIEFMAVATARLGRRGFMYAGWPFLQVHGLADLPFRYMWWLPAYGANDGKNYGIGFLPLIMQGLVVIHQFTSHGGLDQNVIYKPLAYGYIAPVGGVHKVQPQYTPALPPFVSTLVRPEGAWGLSDDGGIFTLAGPFLGAMAGTTDFAGRHGSRLVIPGTKIDGANPPFPSYPSWALYEVIATSGERYLPKKP